MSTNDQRRQEPRADVFGRYALLGRRYQKLMSGSFMELAPEERSAFGESLARDAVDISDSQLSELFAGDWRERITAAWLVGFDMRAGFRKLIEERLIAGELRTGKAYSFALARFGDRDAAEALVEHLRRSLALHDVRSDQPWAIGALLVLDDKLKTDFASEFTGQHGVWERWVQAGISATFTAEGMKNIVTGWCDFAEVSMQRVHRG